MQNGKVEREKRYRRRNPNGKSRLSDFAVFRAKNVRPGFLISHFSQSSENEKTRTYTSRLRCRKMQNPIEILREFFFSGHRYGPRNFYTVPVSLFRVFKNFLTDYASLFKGHLVRVFKKNPPFFLPFFFLILFSSFFLSSSLRTHFNV